MAERVFSAVREAVGDADFRAIGSASLTQPIIFSRGNYILTVAEKQKILLKLSEILDQMTDISEPAPVHSDVPEMLTVKECAKVIKGVTEHAVRQLVRSEKIPSIRVGNGKYGKILISKWDLVGYFNGEKTQKTPPPGVKKHRVP